MLIPSKWAGAIIGKGGVMINKLRDEVSPLGPKWWFKLDERVHWSMLVLFVSVQTSPYYYYLAPKIEGGLNTKRAKEKKKMKQFDKMNKMTNNIL